MSRSVEFCRCGTPEEWENARQAYQDAYRVVPATIYVSEHGLCLVTSSSWVDWLMGRTDVIPDIDA